MAIFTADEIGDTEVPVGGVLMPDDPKLDMTGQYDAWDVFKAGFSRESDIVGFYEEYSNPMPELSVMENEAYRAGMFNPFEHIKGTEYDNETMHGMFADLKSAAQVKWRMERIDLERRRINTLDSAPLYQTLPGEIMGGIFSTTTLIDAGVIGKSLKLPMTVGRKALGLGGYNMAMTAVQEQVLHEQQMFRTNFESVMAVAGAGVIGGGVGAMTGYYGRKIDPADMIDETSRMEMTTPDSLEGSSASKSGGAAQVELDLDLETARAIDDDVANPNTSTTELDGRRAKLDAKAQNYALATPAGVAIGTVFGAISKMLPDVALATNKEWGTARRFATHFLNHTIDTVGSLKGMHTVPVDTLLRRGDRAIDAFTGNITTDGYTKYITGSTGMKARMATAYKGKWGDVPMTREQFEVEIQKYITGGMKDPNVIPEVAESADLLKRNVIDPIGRRAVDLGYLKGGDDGLPVAPLGDQMWFIRNWNRAEAMRMGKAAWAEEMMGYHQNRLWTNAAEEADQVKRQIAETEEEIKGMEADLEGDIQDAIRARMGEKGREESFRIGYDMMGGAAIKQPLSKAEMTHINVVTKAKNKQAAAKMRKQAKKMPHHARLDNSLTPEGRAKLRKKFESHYDSIVDEKDAGTFSDFAGRGVRMEGDQVVLSPARSMDVATADVLENHPELLGSGGRMLDLAGALKRMNRTLTMTEQVQHTNGDPTLKYWFDELEEEFQVKQEELRRDLKEGKLTEKQFEKALAKADRQNRSLQAHLNRAVRDMYEIYDAPERQWLFNLGSSLKASAVLGMMGSVLASTLPELVAPLGAVGMRNYARNVASAVLDFPEWRRLTKVQKEEFALGIQSAQFMRMAEMGDFEHVTGKFHRGLRKGADTALDYAYGLGVWTRGATSATGVMVQSKLARLMMKFDGFEKQAPVKVKRTNAKGEEYEVEVMPEPKIKGLSKRDLEQLGAMGITRDMIPGMAEQVKKHSKKLRGGTRDINLGEWDNKSLAGAVRDAVVREVNNTVIEPGAQAAPFVGRNMALSIVMQFKTFMLASTSKYWLQDLQRIFRGDMRGAERQAALFGMGYLTMRIKAELIGKDLEDEPWGNQIVDTMDYGGGLGLVGMAINAGYNHFVDDTVRYSGNKNLYGMVVGPGGQMLIDGIYNGANALKQAVHDDPEGAKDSLKKMKVWIPGNNHYGVRIGQRLMEDEE